MITQSELLRRFVYNSESGQFFRRLKKNKLKLVGDYSSGRYFRISINKSWYLVHRLAWLYEYGEFPDGEIDHINHDRFDNRISNLRIVSREDNCRNMSKSKANTSGTTGVNWHKHQKRWVARIHVDKKRIELGAFIEFSDAVNARKNAEVLYGYHENHGS